MGNSYHDSRKLITQVIPRKVAIDLQSHHFSWEAQVLHATPSSKMIIYVHTCVCILALNKTELVTFSRGYQQTILWIQAVCGHNHIS